MFNVLYLSAVLTALLIISIPDVASYNKYGRSCKDIGCLSSEVCVMAEDPCTIYTRDKCGRYPTCKKVNAGEASCTSIICPDNDYCRTENGVPKCVSKTASNGFESAGVDVVNGQRVSSNSDTNKSTDSKTNPFANANAPPQPVDTLPSSGGSHQANFGNNYGYYASPGNTGQANDNHGYPPYPSTNQGSNHPRTDNLGYPPYPTQNKMPQPGYPPYSGQPLYPQLESGGYPQYPNSQRNPVGQYPGYQNYPGYPNYPNQNHRVYSYNSNPNYRKNSSADHSASFITVCLINLVLVFLNRS